MLIYQRVHTSRGFFPLSIDLEAVFFGHLESIHNGIVHSGDNLTGEWMDQWKMQVFFSWDYKKVFQYIFWLCMYVM